ncbi:MAG: hypothetical protein JXD18_04175 [Anaerolineae bacterium]|nr:hypothetical protein [Anaerolineae bacterium]
MELKNPSPIVRARRWWNLRDSRTKIIMIVAAVFFTLVACLAIALLITSPLSGGTSARPTDEPDDTALASQSTSTPAPTNTLLPPTDTPVPPTPEPTPTPIPSDPQSDVTAYEGGPAVEDAPAGVDIRMASIAPTKRVVLQPSPSMPAELVGWATQEDALFWVTLHQPVPDPPQEYTEWLFALDLDGNTATGRPADSARINPDIGMEVAVGLYYEPSNASYTTYFLVWNPAQGSFASPTADVRYTISESRTVIGIALPLETLTQAVASTTGVTVDPTMAQGRAAAIGWIGNQRVIDFYPDRPE